MRSNYLKTLKTAVLAISVLLLGAAVSFGQSVNLTAQAGQVVLPDGSLVPMWGYACNGVSGTGVSCSTLNPTPKAGTTWNPVVITVPSLTTTFTINLTNGLPAPVPTSLVIVGQLGGGLGAPGGVTPAPDHSNAQTTTWPISDPTTTGTPPGQGPRVQSFGTQVASGNTAALTWSNLRPGTYLLESGTHPSIQGPMGLYGILVVTTAPAGTTAGTAYPGVAYSADVPFLLSEIDPVQNAYVQSAVHTAGFSETAVWSGKAGACGDITSATHTCYPPAVNYTPLYYLVNG